MLKILHVLSQNQITGAEVYAAELAESHIKLGHTVFIVSDKFHTPTRAKLSFQPIDNRKHFQRFKNIRFLKNLIESEKIDVVHAHSRASSWVCYFALRGKKIPLISTVHGRQHLHTSTWLYDIYGDIKLPVCENLKEHLIQEVKMKKETIQVIHNGFDFSSSRELVKEIKREDNSFVISLVGRTTGPKGVRTSELMRDVFPALLEQYPKLHVQIVGGDPKNFPVWGIKKAAELHQQYRERFQVKGFVSELPKLLKASHLVIGSGRVAIEALWLGTPVLALGEAQYESFVSQASVEQAARSNFGDCSTHHLADPEINTAQILNDVKRVIEGELKTESLQEWVEAKYSVEILSQKVLEIYQSTRMKKFFPDHIPALMYHKVVDQSLPSKHRIFISRERFESHLQFFKKNQFTAITFQEYLSFRQGAEPLSRFPKKPIFITFDDAYVCTHENAFPLLKRYEVSSTLFVLGDRSIKKNNWDEKEEGVEESQKIMSRDQIKEWVLAGNEVGAHSLTHPHLNELPSEAAFQEISESKESLENEFQKKIVSFAYPYGEWNDPVKDLVSKAGFSFGISTDSGGMHLEDDLFQVFRVNVFPEDGLLALKKKTSPQYRRYYKMKRGK